MTDTSGEVRLPHPITIPESGLYRFSAEFGIRGPLLGRPATAADFQQEWGELVKVNDDGSDGELVDLWVAEP